MIMVDEVNENISVYRAFINGVIDIAKEKGCIIEDTRSCNTFIDEVEIITLDDLRKCAEQYEEELINKIAKGE